MTVTGEIFLNSSAVDEVKKSPQGMLIYRGMKKSKQNPHKMYFDVKILSKEQVEMLSSVQ